MNQHLPGLDLIAGSCKHFADEAVDIGAQLRIVRRPHHSLPKHGKRKRNDKDNARNGQRRDERAPAAASGQCRPQEYSRRLDQHRDQNQQRREHAQQPGLAAEPKHHRAS